MTELRETFIKMYLFFLPLNVCTSKDWLFPTSPELQYICFSDILFVSALRQVALVNKKGGGGGETAMWLQTEVAFGAVFCAK